MINPITRMKHIFLLCLVLTSLTGSLIASSQPDTVIIRLSDREEIKIISNSGNELEKLSRYDLNKIIRELREKSQDNAEESVLIVMEDESGTRYMLENGDENEAADTSVSKELEGLEKEVDQLNETMKDDEAQKEGVQFNKEAPKRTSSTFIMEFGLNNYLLDNQFPDVNNALYAVNPVTSWYVALGGMNSTHILGPLSLDWGANVSWYNFKFDNERTRVLKTDEGVVFYEDLNTDFEAIKSKIVVPYLNVSLVPMFIFGKGKRSDWSPFSYHEHDGFRFGLGAYTGYRIGGRSKSVIKDDGNRERDKDITNFYFNNWRYGARLQLGFRGVDIFANYDLNKLFADERGPQLNAFSFGIIL